MTKIRMYSITGTPTAKSADPHDSIIVFVWCGNRKDAKLRAAKLFRKSYNATHIEEVPEKEN